MVCKHICFEVTVLCRDIYEARLSRQIVASTARNPKRQAAQHYNLYNTAIN